MRRASALLLLAGCVSLPHVAPPAPVPPLVHGAAGPEVERLLADFYGDGLDPGVARARAEEVLRRYPDSSKAHEVAGFAAQLQGDGEAAWRHFLRAAADLDADATELYLWELGREPRAQAEVTMQLLGELARSHPRPSVRAAAALQLARLDDDYGRFAEEEAQIRSLAPLADFRLLGALDNDQGKGFLAEYPPESGAGGAIDLVQTVPGPLVPLRWRKVERLTRLGAVPLGELLWPRDFAVAYLATWVHVDAARKGQLRITSDSPARVFVDGGLVLSEEQIQGADFDNLIAPLDLSAGWHQILIKSAHKRGGWGLLARITDEAGAPLAGLTASADPQRFTPAKARTDTDSLAAEGPLSGPDGRKQLLGSLFAARAGRALAELRAAQALLEAHPRNPLAQFHAAIGYLDNEEQGKAIDLLNQAVDGTRGRAAAILVRRGLYYRDKEMWEKAQADLTAAAGLSPATRLAQVQLAVLFEKRNWQADRCRLLDQLLGRWPDFGWALRERAECADAQGFLAQADQLLARAVALRPGDDEAWSRRFELARRRGDFAAARRYIAELEALAPSGAAHVADEGEIARRQGRDGEARALFGRAAAMQPEWPRPHERLANLEYELGRKPEALAAWKRALERDPANTQLAQRIEFLEPIRLGFVEKLVPSEADIDRALVAPVKPHPSAQVAVRLDHEVTEVAADGSSRRVVTQVAQALDDKGRDALTHPRLPGWGTLKILRAYAIGDHGEHQEASSIRGATVRFRNLQVGSKTVLQYIHYSPAHFLPGAFVSSWNFQTVGWQQEDSTWVLVLPRGKKLLVEKSGAFEDHTTTDGDKVIRTFHAAHVPPLTDEPHMPPPGDLLTSVEVSTVDGWDEFVRWQRALLADAFRTNSALDALTDKLTAGAKSPHEKLDRLFHHVTQEVRYQQDYETPIAGVRPHAAPVVIERGYGDCKDKAVLLIEMAKRAGVKLEFAVLRTTPAGRVRREVPNQEFNHAIVWAPAQPGISEPEFLDPTSDGLDLGNLRADDQGALSLVIDPDGGAWAFRPIPYQAPDLQYDHHQIKVVVSSPTAAEVTDRLSARGSTAMALRHVLRNQGDAKKLFESLAASLLAGATLREGHAEGDREDILTPLKLVLTLDGAQAIHPEEDHFRLALPGSFRLAGAVALRARETPLRLGAPDSSQYRIDAELPEGYRVEHPPADFTVEHPCFRLARSSKIEARKIALTIDYRRSCSEIAPADYPGFREAVLRAAHRFGDELTFGEAPRAPEKKRR